MRWKSLLVHNERDTDNDWKLIAERDPYWGVLSAEQYRAGAITPETISEFFLTGEYDVSKILMEITNHFEVNFRPGRILDFGCGVGRLSLAFARRASEVVGVDVAPAMLELCQAHADEMQLDNITLIKADDDMSQVAGTFDLVNSFIVFQHIPPSRGYRIIERLVQKIRPGGFGSIHVTYARARKHLNYQLTRSQYYRQVGSMCCALGHLEADAEVGNVTMYDYDLNAIMSILTAQTDAPILTVPTNDDDHLGARVVFRVSRQEQ